MPDGGTRAEVAQQITDPLPAECHHAHTCHTEADIEGGGVRVGALGACPPPPGERER